MVGFFVVEHKRNQEIYWHLTAINPRWQGRGYGYRAWLAMLRHHQMAGYRSVTTTISAGNSRVLNLYAKLGFRFIAPEKTFHWVNELA
ncbi:acetyltransferase, GNAT family [Luminiphilus syltensis NOR5-1B]|uniref:Acetyltransferase, GNAT family n=1 Tax=Luminiphilus syltensis NOR5-1B TaxID=565045 RepID=B8KR34_9GAMM|nr:acetyltransferase, GNAT family [Luminiphilus syltensis NOR5-1B]